MVDGRFDIGLKPGATVRMKATAGTVEGYCKFHPTMVAARVVKERRRFLQERLQSRCSRPEAEKQEHRG